MNGLSLKPSVLSSSEDINGKLVLFLKCLTKGLDRKRLLNTVAEGSGGVGSDRTTSTERAGRAVRRGNATDALNTGGAANTLRTSRSTDAMRGIRRERVSSTNGATRAHGSLRSVGSTDTSGSVG